jgi:hypothetical protein
MAKDLNLGLPDEYAGLSPAQQAVDYQGLNQLLAQDPSMLRRLLESLRLSGNITKSKQYGTDVLSGGGRVGLQMDDMGIGIGGGGYKAKGAWGKQQDFNLNSIDANYGNYGAYYSPEKAGLTYQDQNSRADIGYSPSNKLLQLMYGRQF